MELKTAKDAADARSPEALASLRLADRGKVSRCRAHPRDPERSRRQGLIHPDRCRPPHHILNCILILFFLY